MRPLAKPAETADLGGVMAVVQIQRRRGDESRILAVLGPTNTGKTHFAVERMLAHASGMIGFPLRLLAREIYDRIVQIKGPEAVALFTGEEKISPAAPRYVVATVEAMPIEREVAFLAVDEIQLCADRERGHVFTDRLLRARGTEETMFLGADTIRPLLRKLVPSAEIVGRPRFSTLLHTGTAKLTRLPRRSAIVAFTAQDVYALAEIVRRQRGGAAVVLGALSPRTRNAQVALYQEGEVDYLVATDAVGMGLNMDLGHVAFASLAKFDGVARRRLTTAEMAQIAGRAGRHMNDGSFGTTNGVGEIEPREVEAIESHVFPPLKALRWRNAELDTSSVAALQASLDAAPFAPCLLKVRDALDDRSLGLLARRDEIKSRADRPARVRLLWQVCQIPDFRKTLTDAHLHLLARVYQHLTGPEGVLPHDWVAKMVTRLERTEGDIDALVGRIAHIRTWTYMSQRADWLKDPAYWQERTRAIEDKLSDALHERLTQRFVDRRTSALLRSLRESGDLPAEIASDGQVVVDGHEVGRLDGLAFQAERGEADLERRALNAAARRVLGPELRRRATALIEADDRAFALDDAARITWNGAAIARLRSGPAPLAPRIELLVGEELPARARHSVRDRLATWLDAEQTRTLAPLLRLQASLAESGLQGPGRGLAFRLVEGLGTLAADKAKDLLAAMGEGDRRALTRLGVRYGMHHLHMPALLKARAVALRFRLCAVHAKCPRATGPLPGRTWFARDPQLSADAHTAFGYAAFSEIALRVDILERLTAALRARAREGGPFALAPELCALTGLSTEALGALVDELGYRRQAETGGQVLFLRPRERREQARASGPPRQRQVALRREADSPFAILARLRPSG